MMDVREIIAEAAWSVCYLSELQMNLIADAVLAALEAEGIVLSRMRSIGTADYVDQLISLDEDWSAIPAGLRLPHLVFVPVEG